MNRTRIVFGIGLVLAVLVAFTASVAADGTGRFDPQHGNGTTGEWVKVIYYVDIESGENVAAAQQTIKFNPDIITVGVVTVEHDCGAAPPTGEGQYCWGAFDHNDTYLPNGYSWSFNGDPRISEWHGPPDYPPPGQWVWESLIGEGFDHTNTDGTIEIATYWVQPQTGDIPGVSPFDFGSEQFPPGCLICQHTGVANWTPRELPMIFENGTFTHMGEPETFSKELVKGWNLVSLPLTASDMKVASVFESISSNSSAIYRYDAETKHFVVLSADNVLGNGVGYFIYMTSADTWTYEGVAYGSMNVGLSQGLNMVGWLNGTKDIEDALSSIEGKYRYTARWNSTTDKFEVYVPGAPSAFNDFNTMEQGMGYFVSMKVDGETLSENR